MPGLAVLPLNIPPDTGFRTVTIPKVEGEINDVELKVLCYLCHLLKPKRVFEIGTFRGRTTLALAMSMDGGEEGQLFTLDVLAAPAEMTERDESLMLPYDEIGAVYRGVDGYSTEIFQLFGDSKRYNFAPYHDSIDFIFIDGSHDFWSTLFDLYNAKKMITGRGTIICHDYGPWEKGVTDAVSVFWQQYQLTGVHIQQTSLVCFGKDIIDICFPH